jgi:transcription-repair coupling factor (superfamily II helicase)
MAPADLLTAPLPSRPGDRRYWGCLHGSAMSLAVASASSTHDGLCLLVTADSHEAEKLTEELDFFLDESTPVLHFPDWETLAYDSFSPHQDIISARLFILNTLAEIRRGVLVVPVMTLMHRIAPRRFMLGSSLILDVGEKFDIDEMRHKLEASAYRCVETVYEHGEFAVRGSIMDIFPMGSTQPFRIDLFDDEIETLRTFNAETQISIETVDHIRLLPAREFPLDQDTISQFQDRWHQTFDVDARDCPLYQDVSSGLSPSGIEYYLPLFFDQVEILLDYLPENTLIFSSDKIEESAHDFWRNAVFRHENLRYDRERPILDPASIFVPVDELFGCFKEYPQVQLTQRRVDEKTGRVNHVSRALPDVSVNERSGRALQKLEQFTKSSDSRILICAESAGRREALLELFAGSELTLAETSSWASFLSTDTTPAITVAPLEQGLWLQQPGITLVTEPMLFGDHVLQKRRRERQKESSAELIIKSLTELRIGAPVVHIDHGVGRYLGLQTLTINDQATEFLTLEYQEGDKLYVPVSSLHLISRYSGADEDSAPLHRLGSDTWQKAKRKAAEKIHDVAAELLNIYARREAKKGFPFATPNNSYFRFSAAFPFEETPDQQTAIQQVIRSMTDEKAMDLLVCGDVGFGKTEVAMRAAYLAVQSGKQVAVLVPTTLLAQQHLETFKDRFADWPVSIDVVSRFRTSKEQRDIRAKLMSGKLDIIIGTHVLIQEGLSFKNLGLLIIDEEHRFGVRQKERLKSLRSDVDILTLTATPIPRTLNLAMSGMRDLSIIATPPAKRLSIRTFVRQRQDGLIKEAIQRELLRGGQVFYLHNEVKTIENTAHKIQELLPEARIAIGHGQMRERQLEKVMSDFYHKRSNVLVCTTIIETGIDIPSANTIIIDRADKFGLAQIHQLRGRVGRSHHQAYAFLLTPHRKAMTSDALKRLEAITSAEALGSGFILASHDLEIRGAGELLGEDQTGHLQAIGFTLYMEMLERAVQAIKDGKTPNLDRPLREGTEINLRVAALIPEDYLPDVHTRLILYKRISNATGDAQLRELQVEMIDRFGLLPEPTKTLFRLTGLKLKAEHLGIKKIDAGPNGGRLEFSEDTQVEPFTIVRLVQSEPHRYRLGSANQLRFDEKMEKLESRFEKIDRLLDRLRSTSDNRKATG